MPELREDLINSAITFLKDHQVANSSLAKRIEFLESKDLTHDEIQEALKRAGSDTSSNNTSTADTKTETSTNSTTTTTAPTTTQTPNSNDSPVTEHQQSQHSPVPYAAPPQYRYPTYDAPPPVPQRDWRDYFVMATVTAGVGYGIYELARRYVLPLIVPPTPTALEADKQALENEFARAQAVLDQIQKESEELKATDEARTKKVDDVLQELESAIAQVKSQADKRDEEMKLIKLQMETVKNELPLALDRHSDNQQYALNDLLTELKALKQLVSARIKPQASIPPPPMPSVYSNKNKMNTSTTSSSSSLPITTTLPSNTGNIGNTNPPPSVFSSSGNSASSPSVSAPSAATTSSAASSASVPTTSQEPSTASASSPANDIFASMPSFNRAKGGIPAWQLAKKTETASSSEAS